MKYPIAILGLCLIANCSFCQNKLNESKVRSLLNGVWISVGNKEDTIKFKKDTVIVQDENAADIPSKLIIKTIKCDSVKSKIGYYIYWDNSKGCIPIQSIQTDTLKISGVYPADKGIYYRLK